MWRSLPAAHQAGMHALRLCRLPCQLDKPLRHVSTHFHPSCRAAANLQAAPGWLAGLLKPFTSQQTSAWANLSGQSLAEVLDGITQVIRSVPGTAQGSSQLARHVTTDSPMSPADMACSGSFNCMPCNRIAPSSGPCVSLTPSLTALLQDRATHSSCLGAPCRTLS